MVKARKPDELYVSFENTLRRIVREEIERRLGPPHADLLAVGEKTEIADMIKERSND